jgi:hypothetical protein
MGRSFYRTKNVQKPTHFIRALLIRKCCPSHLPAAPDARLCFGLAGDGARRGRDHRRVRPQVRIGLLIGPRGRLEAAVARLPKLAAVTALTVNLLQEKGIYN